MAAPGAMIAYALLGTSRTLVVSATTATSAVSAAAVGPLAGGDAIRFAAFSAARMREAGLDRRVPVEASIDAAMAAATGQPARW